VTVCKVVNVTGHVTSSDITLGAFDNVGIYIIGHFLVIATGLSFLVHVY